MAIYLFFIYGDMYTDAAGFVEEVKNWPAFFPIIHHDIAKEIPINAQKLQYLAFASWLGIFYLCAYVMFISMFAIGMNFTNQNFFSNDKY